LGKSVHPNRSGKKKCQGSPIAVFKNQIKKKKQNFQVNPKYYFLLNA